MDPSDSDLRTNLDAAASAHQAPDPHTVLSGAQSRAKTLIRQRTAGRWAALAAAVAVIGGGSLLLGGTDDLATQVDPAVPHESYADGYGIVDGEIQPYMDGMKLVDVATIEAGQQRLVQVDSGDDDVQLYAVAWCSGLDADDYLVEETILASQGDDEVAMSCHDQSLDADTNSLATALPPLNNGYLVSNRSAGTTLVAIFRESPWTDYPFPPADPAPFPAPQAGTVVIDGNTPPSRADDIAPVSDGFRVFKARVPINEDTATLTVEINSPGQVLVAANGRVLTNDVENLPGQPDDESDGWTGSDPSAREGFVASFGPQTVRWYSVSKFLLERSGLDLSDGMLDITVYPQGFVDRSAWRVSYNAGGVEGTADRDQLSPDAETTLPEYAFGHRRVAAFEVPTDGAPRSIAMTSEEAATLTWVVECPELVPDDRGNFQPEIGTVAANTVVGPLQCFGLDQGWSTPLRPGDFTETSNRGELPTLTATAAEGTETQVITAYEPVAFEDFPFGETGDVPSYEAPTDGEPYGDEGFYREATLLTSGDLDSDGTVLIDVPKSMFTEFYVTTEGVGRFWLEPTEPDGDVLTPRGEANAPASNFGGEDFWTSWTDAKSTWAITAETDSGDTPEQVRLRVEGYEEGSFELQVVGLFGANEQP